MRKVIANTTPLIALAEIGQLELLHQLYEEILIPQAVMDDFVGICFIRNMTSLNSNTTM